MADRRDTDRPRPACRTRSRAARRAAEQGNRVRRPSSARLANSAVAAAGTVVSRMSGFVRFALLAAALGASCTRTCSASNTIPNMLYILLAGGVVNAVLVPQAGCGRWATARRWRCLHEPDHHPRRAVPRHGHRLLVAAALGDGRLPLTPGTTPRRWSRKDSVIAFARFCLPGLLLRHVRPGRPDLNARGRFGPMM